MQRSDEYSVLPLAGSADARPLLHCMRNVCPDELGAHFDRAAFEPDYWPKALEHVGAALYIKHFNLLRMGAGDFVPMAPESAQEVVSLYLDGKWQEHDLLAYRVPRYAEMKLFTDTQLVSASERRSSDYYRGFAELHDIPHSVGWRISENGDTYIFAGFRSRDMGLPSEEDLARVSTIMGRASTAAMISANAARIRTRGLIEGLESANSKAIALGHGGVVLGLTAPAQRLMTADFKIERGRLWARAADAARVLGRLNAALKDAEEPLPGRFIISRRGRKRGIVAMPVRASEAARDAFRNVRAVLVLKDLDARPDLDEAPLRALFGLTHAEANVALLVTSGLSPGEIAERRGVEVDTVRTVLKSIFHKTDTHRQNELTALVLRAMSGD